MAMNGILCRLSPKRLDLLREEPSLLSEVILERHDTRIPGLLDLGKTWDALDLMISDRGSDQVLGDAVLGRGGSSFGPTMSFGRPRLLAPERVNEIARELAVLGDDLVRDRYDRLRGKNVHGNFGPDGDEEEEDPEGLEEKEAEIEELTRHYRALRDLYAEAASSGHSILIVVV
jgi:hypothetical protein